MVGVLPGSGRLVGREDVRIRPGLSGSGAEGALRVAHASTLMWNAGDIIAECARGIPACTSSTSTTFASSLSIAPQRMASCLELIDPSCLLLLSQHSSRRGSVLESRNSSVRTWRAGLASADVEQRVRAQQLLRGAGLAQRRQPGRWQAGTKGL